MLYPIDTIVNLILYINWHNYVTISESYIFSGFAHFFVHQFMGISTILFEVFFVIADDCVMLITIDLDCYNQSPLLFIHRNLG